MKKMYLICVLIMAAAIGAFMIAGRHIERQNFNQRSKAENQPGAIIPGIGNQSDSAKSMTITSPLFLHNGGLPIFATCDGKGVNPPLGIGGVPKGAKSLAIIVEDPDAPGGTFVHWVLWNIDPSTTIIEENSVPDGATQGLNSDQRVSYVAACPPSGTHRYIFNLYALDETLDLPASTTALELRHAIEGHILDNAHLIGLYR